MTAEKDTSQPDRNHQEPTNQPSMTRREFVDLTKKTVIGVGLMGGFIRFLKWIHDSNIGNLTDNLSGNGFTTPEYTKESITRSTEQSTEQLTEQPTASSESTPFSAEETGIYNQENLLKLREIEPQPKIDERIGAVHVNGLYPRGKDIGFFEYGVDVLANLGFQTTEIALVPQEFTKHTGIGIAPGTTLDQLAQRPDVAKVFENPSLKNVIVTAEVAGPGTVNAWQLPENGSYTPEALQATYEEYYRFASVMLDKYGNSGKDIIILGPNELDWHALGGTPGAISRTGEDLPDHVLENAKKYLNQYLRAITDANKDHSGKRPLKTAIEINRIEDALRGKRRLINSVIPNLEIQPNIVGYSSYDMLYDSAALKMALDYIKKLTPKSRVIISEFGIPENGVLMSREEIAKQYHERIQLALDWGVEYFMIWQLTDNECQQANPNNEQCNGFWIVRPDGSLFSELYDDLKSY